MPAVRSSSPPKRPTKSKPYVVQDGKTAGAHVKQQYDNEYDPLYILSKNPRLVIPESPRPPPLTLRDLECLRTLGAGSYGSVYLVRTRRCEHPLDKPGSLFALKVVERKECRNLSHREHFRETQRERYNMQNLPFTPFLAGLVQSFEDSRNLYLMLEFIPYGNLQSLMNKFTRMSPHMMLFYFANITCGLFYMHQNSIIHGDLKPDNILVGADGYLAIADFGSTSHTKWDERIGWSNRGTMIYQAPECLDKAYNAPYTVVVDWWSAGIILCEMAVVKVPFWSGCSDRTEHNIKHLSFQWPSDVPAGRNLKDLVSQLLRKRPADRLGHNMCDVQNHPWLENVNWNRLLQQQYMAPYIPDVVPPTEQWHRHRLPQKRELPGVAAIVEPPLHLMHDNRYRDDDL